MNKSSGFENIPLDLVWGDKAVREVIRDFFDESPLDENRKRIYGEADNITKAGCLALARKGVLVWNTWRKEFPFCGITLNNFVDFSDHEFSFIDPNYFGNFEFGDHADFSRAVFPSGCSFTGAKFGRSCKFVGTRWGDGCDFASAIFGEYADFRGAQFGINTSFYKTEFNDFTQFVGSQFGGNTNFLCAKFNGYVNFSASNWARVKQLTSWTDTQFTEAQKFSSARGIASDNFGQIDFRGAQFLGGPASNGETSVDFSNRKFQGKTDFSSCDGVHTKFCSVPKFLGCEFCQDTKFEDADFPHATGNEKAIIAYQTLKNLFHNLKNFEQEEFFLEKEEYEKVFCNTGWKFYCSKVKKCLRNPVFSIFILLAFWIVLALISSGLYAEPPHEKTCLRWEADCFWEVELFIKSLFESFSIDVMKKPLADFSLYKKIGIGLHKMSSVVLLSLAGYIVTTHVITPFFKKK